MASLVTIAIAGALLLHGLIHVMGSGVYLGLVELSTFEYKTTVLLGNVDLGETGTRLFGILWAVAAAGFAASAATLLLDWTNWKLLLASVTALSLALTVLDIGIAYAGFVVNLAIVAGLVSLQ